MGNGLFEAVKENLAFLGIVFVVVALIFAVAYAAEKMVKKKKGVTERILSTRKVAMIGMFSAISGILMTFEIQVPFAPPFYTLDFSELPVLVSSFAFGPVAGVMTEFCKVVLKLLIKSTSTAFVGDFANFVIGCTLILPASIIYQLKKTKKMAAIASTVGTICMTIFGTAFNAIYLLPTFAVLYGMDMNTLIGMGTAVNPAINSVTTLVIMAVAPLNLLKAGIVSLVTLLIYKKISVILKAEQKMSNLQNAKL